MSNSSNSPRHPVLAFLTSSWTLFCVMVFGVGLLMVSVRPELQSPRGQSRTATNLTISGHTLTWTSAAVLTVRAIRKSREQPEPEPELRPELSAEKSAGEPPIV